MSRPRRTDVLYLCVTQDKYGLPVAIAESVDELAELIGISSVLIWQSFTRYNRRAKKGIKHFTVRSYPRFVRIEKPNEDEELVTDEMWEHYQKWKKEQK